MGDRRAFLIGVEDYGEGFSSLPAVRQDLRLMQAALEACGYRVESCPEDVYRNASNLDEAIRTFCAAGGPNDVRLLYFTGHGLRVGDDDCIVPAGTGRRDAATRQHRRVSTDLSGTVADAKTGLVLFVIDACRDQPSSKGGSGWGSPGGLAAPAEHRFLRLFGCTANEVCQVLRPAAGSEPEVSLFTKALSESLEEGAHPDLENLLIRVQERCGELWKEHPELKQQSPRLSKIDEISADLLSDVMKRPIFGLGFTPGAERKVLPGVWPAFDVGNLHCLVVTAEYEDGKAPQWGLRDLVQDALQGKKGSRIWEAFWNATNDRKLVSGGQRVLPRGYTASAVSFASFSVLEAMESLEAFDISVRAVVEADIVAFDVTGFQPGVMLLIGVRAACRRSFTICSHGADWEEGKPLEIPFNLQDLNINSHTPRTTLVDKNGVVERFVRRVVIGFEQVSRHPSYLDLPAYDALRELGSSYDASSTIDVGERVFVLCSYRNDLFARWEAMRSGLEGALTKLGKSPEIERVIDYPTSQLIWQGLYEQLRRTAACIVDWSGYSESVFLELGVRLAISEWGAVQLVAEDHLPGGKRAPKLAQVEGMYRLFSPLTYADKESATFAAAAEALVRRNPPLDGDASYNRVHRVLIPVIDAIQEVHPPVFEELRHRADSLHHPQQGRAAPPQILFHGSRSTKHDSEKAALERRIAAWLYLEHRVGRLAMKEDVALLSLYRRLGRDAVDALYDLGDIDFAGYIEDRLAQLG